MRSRGLKRNIRIFAWTISAFFWKRAALWVSSARTAPERRQLIRAILNQVIRDAGEVRLWGKDNIKCETELKNRVGVVLDEGHYYGHLPIRKMTNMIAPFYHNWNADAYRRYSREFDLDEIKKISELSKGMRMKYGIALALSHSADLLIMDEPTSGLDPLIREELLDILQNMILDERKSVFFSTHITSDQTKLPIISCSSTREG